MQAIAVSAPANVKSSPVSVESVSNSEDGRPFDDVLQGAMGDESEETVDQVGDKAEVEIAGEASEESGTDLPQLATAFPGDLSDQTIALEELSAEVSDETVVLAPMLASPLDIKTLPDTMKTPATPATIDLLATEDTIVDIAKMPVNVKEGGSAITTVPVLANKVAFDSVMPLAPVIDKAEADARGINLDAMSAAVDKGQVTQHAVSKLTSSAMATEVRVPVGEKGWNEAMAQKISFLIGKQVQQAEIRLSPDNMGPIEMKLSIHNDQANIQLAAQNQSVREALESSIPRLREMLSDQSFQQLNVDVNSGWKNAEQNSQFSSSGTGEDSLEEGDLVDSVTNAIIESKGLLDQFA